MRELPARRQSAAALAILALTGGALALSATREARVPAASEESAGVLDPEELARLGVGATPVVSRRVARIRGLRFDSVPEPEVITGEGLGEIERREIERTGGTTGLGADEATARILGLLESDEQLENAVASSGQLAAAAYDPRTDRLYIVSDAVAANEGLVEFLLSHELNHALEDQRFGVTDPSKAPDDDVALAGLALSEGTATAVMVDYARGYMDALELAAATAGVDGSTGAVPGFVVEQLEWAYLGGMEFITELRGIADGWKLVDYALSDRPPASTEQVLHPEKYIRNERPLPVEIDGSELAAAGWRRADEGVAGEYSTRQLLELGAEETEAAEAAAGWGGDRFELWRGQGDPAGCTGTCREELALVVRWRLDSTRDAREISTALAAYVESGLGGSSVGSGVWDVDGGSVAAARTGDEVTLVFAPDAGLAEAVANPTSGPAGVLD